MNSCLHCRYAEWQRTANGRVHPTKVGQCTYKAVYHVPASHSAGPVTISGGYIWRKNPKVKCPTFQPIESR
jgi:hypothetical protein